MNRFANQLSVVVALAGLGAVGLPACSSSDSPSSPSAGSSRSPAGSATSSAAVDTTNCTKEGLADAATAAAQAMGADNLYTIDDVQCADGWVVTAGLLASESNPAMGAPTSFVFQQQGEQWVARDKPSVCGTNPTATPAPADAKIPVALYESGCLAG